MSSFDFQKIDTKPQNFGYLYLKLYFKISKLFWLWVFGYDKLENMKFHNCHHTTVSDAKAAFNAPMDPDDFIFEEASEATTDTDW